MDTNNGPGSPDTWQEADELAAVSVTVNGSPMQLTVTPRHTLADAIRAHGLTGTHLGCEHGVCGACTLLLDDLPVRSCLILAVQAAGQRIETVEGLATGDRLHPLQQAFHDAGALQCGFCTPGFLMLAAGVLRSAPEASADQLREALTANLCRCTGGPPIVTAVRAAQRAARGGGA